MPGLPARPKLRDGVNPRPEKYAREAIASLKGGRGFGVGGGGGAQRGTTGGQTATSWLASTAALPFRPGTCNPRSKLSWHPAQRWQLVLPWLPPLLPWGCGSLWGCSFLSADRMKAAEHAACLLSAGLPGLCRPVRHSAIVTTTSPSCHSVLLAAAPARRCADGQGLFRRRKGLGGGGGIGCSSTVPLLGMLLHCVHAKPCWQTMAISTNEDKTQYPS